MKQYVIYHLRWQASAVVMAPVMWSLGFWIPNEFVRLSLSQAFGAVVFYAIDKWIFNKEVDPCT